MCYEIPHSHLHLLVPFQFNDNKSNSTKVWTQQNYNEQNEVALESLRWQPILTCLSVNRAVYLRSLPSRLNNRCGLSRMIKTISAGIFPFDWSPSFWKVTFVPDFQPGLIAILTSLSSFFGVPSACNTRREIFIFFTQPLLISSRVAYKSCSMGGSWTFSFLRGVWTLNEWDLFWESRIMGFHFIFSYFFFSVHKERKHQIISELIHYISVCM